MTRLPWYVALGCFVCGIVLAQAAEWWYDTRVVPTLPVARCPRADTLVVSVNEWRIGSPTRTVVQPCEDENG